MTKLVAINGTTQTAVVASNGSFVTIDTNLKDVVNVSNTFTTPDAEGWITYNYTGAPPTWAELAEAATTTLTIESTDSAEPDRLLRVPKAIQPMSKRFSGETTTLGQIHEFAQSKYFNIPGKAAEPVLEWVNKVLDQYPLKVPVIAAAGGAFAPDEDLMYYGRAISEDNADCDKLYAQKDSDGSWVERISGQWQPVEDPSESSSLLLLDPESAEALANWVDNPDELNGDAFEFSSHNPIEFGLFAAAEAELDFEFLDRLFDIYDSTERSINASKQVRGQGGKFTPNPGGGQAAKQAPKGRLSSPLPLIPDIAARIDEYLREVAKQRGEEPEAPAEGEAAPEAGAPAAGEEAEKEDKRETNTFTAEPIEGVSEDYKQALVEAYGDTRLGRQELAVTAEQAGVPESDVKPLYVAIVDDIETDAVLDLVSLVPPQKGQQGDVSAWKRAAGQWVSAPELLSAMRSSTPPSVVELSDEAVLKEVIEQVDKSTADEQTEDAPVEGETEVAEDGTPAPAAAPLPDKGPAPVKTSNFKLQEGEHILDANDVGRSMQILGELNLEDGKAYVKGIAKGGYVPDEDPEKVAATLQDGEYIISADAWRRANGFDEQEHLLAEAEEARAIFRPKMELVQHIEFRQKAELDPEPDLVSMAARGFAFSDGTMLIRNATELRAALSEADSLEKQLHYIKRARALNRLDLVPKYWNVTEANIAEDLWGPNGELLTIAAAGGADQWRGNAERLRRYWTRGLGGAKIAWGSPRDWTRCVAHLSKYLGVRAKGYCALRHFEMVGYYPGDRRNK